MPCDSERAACAFKWYPAPAARMVGGFASSYEAKSASASEAPSSSHSERAASAFKFKKTKTGSCKMKLALL
ncbi:hypothetical protein QEZ44_16080 [Bacillus cereus]|uniref:Uncharacterized protein n=1 Tax=Bacillus cereus TaxID=1396 RepID=A0A2C1LHW2_BACCE|nr:MULTISPECIES: hypothetical protein [Bacillus]PGZ76412.1 hypothetical protein COE49_01995 [Bacillus sp. AFS029637]MDH4422923.1 hypothetical protein [Bacillus cereus]PER28802.1 hypothetical protein CN476_04460 [Bacillus cereus]PGT97488.1 hypothetical protein COD19_25280 [Bacillus cereus]PGX10531.1 hypothetical protein COE07_13870 [Bacillus sp. AFS033286]